MNVSVGPPQRVGPSRKSRNKRKTHSGSNQQSPAIDHTIVESNLHRLTISDADPLQVRNGFRQLALESTGAVGVCHVIRDAEGVWMLDPRHLTGRVPAPLEFSDNLSDLCLSALTRKSTQVQSLDTIKNCQAMVAPVGPVGGVQEVFLIVLPQTADTGAALVLLEKIVHTFRFWCQSRGSAANQWKLTSLAAMIELVSKIETCETVTKASSLIASELARQLGCTVAISGGRTNRKLKAISDASKLSRSSQRVRMFQQALSESIVRGEAGVWPARSEQQDVLLLAHKQLAGNAQVDCVRSIPLTTPDEKTVGALVLTGSEQVVGSERCEQFLNATAPRIANALAMVARAERSLVTRALCAIPRFVLKIKTLLILAAFAAIVALMFVPMNYRVRCACIVEPVHRRFAVAPFDGLIQQGFVKPGDRVTAQQTLAEMDGRNVRWELAGVTAERRQAVKEHEIELAKRNVSKAMLAQLEDERLAARQNVLEFQQQNLKIVSPIDGVVLSGSLERSEAASVSTGDVMFEIAPLSPLKIEVEIPAEELAQIEQGMPVTVWIDGQEQTPLEGKLARIYPRSELRNSANVFVAEFEFDNSSGQVRPGMNGTARIDAHQRPLGWNLFHKPYDYISSRCFNWW
jgi:hypothetical protein